MIEKYGLCILSDKYFQDFPYTELMQNKLESRPYFLAIREENGIIWLVPLSSQTEKYKAAIAKVEKQRGAGGDIYHYVCKVKGKESAFLIGNTIPVTEEYILRPFTVNGIPYVIKNKADIKEIRTRLAKFLALVRQKKIRPYVDIMEMERKLLHS